MYNSYHKYRIQKLAALKLTDAQLLDKLFSDSVNFLYDKGFLIDAVNYFGLRNTKLLHDKLNTRFLEEWSKATYTCYRDSMFLTFTQFEDLFTDESKSKVFAELIDKTHHFTQNGRKRVIEYLISGSLLPDKDPRLETVFETYYRSITQEQFDAMMKRIDGGVANSTVARVMSKSKVFNYQNYNEQAVKDNPVERLRLLKDIATTTTVLKRLPFEVHFGFEDVKQLAPVMRFEFLQFAFDLDIGVYGRRYYQYSRYANVPSLTELERRIQGFKARRKMDKMKVDWIDPEQVKELLFALSLQKNEVVAAWIEKYTLAYNVKTGKEKIQVYSGY
jgi:hypothetical protein